MLPHINTPDLAGLELLLNSVPPDEAAALVALATSVVAQAVAIRNAPRPAAEPVQDDPPTYTPHPLDVLIFAAIETDGAMQQAELTAALGADSYQSRGKTRPVTAAALKRRLPILVDVGALAKTPAGYIVADPSFVEDADARFA